MFDALREWRWRKASERQIAPFIVMSDATLRDLAQARPSSLHRLREIHGIGEKKCADYGAELLAEIAAYRKRTGAPTDVDPLPGSAEAAGGQAGERSTPSGTRRHAFELFAQGKSLNDVRQATGRAQSTTVEYLVEHIEREGLRDPAPWVDAALFNRIGAIAEKMDRCLKPIFEALEGTVDYDRIRIAVACLRNAVRLVTNAVRRCDNEAASDLDTRISGPASWRRRRSRTRQDSASGEKIDQRVSDRGQNGSGV